MRRKGGTGRAVIVLLVIAVALYVLYFRQTAPVKYIRHKETARHRPTPAAAPAAPTPRAPEQAAPAPSPAYRAKVAIIIDDMGQDLHALDEVLHIDAPVAVAVMPMLAHSAETSRRAHAAGRDVLLHLPMQPSREGMKGLGKGALMDGMAEDEVRRTLSSDLATVPTASGVNNHMGSGLTEDRKEMDCLMGILKERGMYFVDSRTSPASVAYASAINAGVKAASRRVFLDDKDEPGEIKAQLGRLERLALRDGSAIAIGHPRPKTLAAVKDELQTLRSKGIEVVKVSSLVGTGEDRTFLSDTKERRGPHRLPRVFTEVSAGRYQKKANY